MAAEHCITKCCTSCNTSKPIDCYHKDKSKKSGIFSICKQCCSERKRNAYKEKSKELNQKQREYYLKNKERILANNAKSREKHRDIVLLNKKEYYNKVKTDPEWQQQQKDKRRENAEKKRLYDIQYAAENREKISNRAKEWNNKNKEKRAAITFNYDGKRRALEKTGDKSKDILNWKNNQKKVCYWCHKDCADNYHIDHYEPLSKGGSHTIDNLVISCPTCNLTKNAKDPYKFAASVGRLF